MKRKIVHFFGVLVALTFVLPPLRAEVPFRGETYVFPPFSRTEGVRVEDRATYSRERGYGYESDSVRKAGEPFDFSVAVPEGNYHVTVTFGGGEGESDVTVRAELRRLMIERVTTAKGKTATRSFVVNVRRPTFPGGGRASAGRASRGWCSSGSS